MKILKVEFYKCSGKHYATAHIPTTDEQMHQLKAASKFGRGEIYDFIRINQKAVNLPDTFYWVLSFDGTEPLQFLKKPITEG